MKNILFVCTGNTCRSPMAESLFKLKAGNHNPWTSLSAGTHAQHNMPATLEAQMAVKALGANLKNHKSRLLTRELINEADIILVMTKNHKKYIQNEFPNVIHRVYLINELGTSKVKDISDPYGNILEVYKNTSLEINKAIEDLIAFLKLSEI